MRTALLIAAAIALAFLLQAVRLPAAWLFGPLAVAALFAVRGWKIIEVSGPTYIASQAVIGTALGSGFSSETLRVLPQHFAVFLFAVLFILGASLLNGWFLARRTRLDPPTAFLGTMPGGAGAMAAMSDSLGADTRLVVAMQYIRLLIILGCLALFVPVLGHFFPPPLAHDVTLSPIAVGFAWGNFGLLVLLALAGWVAGAKTPIPAGSFLVPALLYFILTWFGFAPGSWPWPIRAAAYAVMGMRIGGQFHPSTVAEIRDILLPVVGTTLLLLTGSVLLAWGLAWKMGLDPVSAYLAATPGGLDSVAAISAELRVDTGVILAVQLVRLLCVLTIGPWLVRGFSRWFARNGRNGTDPNP
jgi:hypothetical protein